MITIVKVTTENEALDNAKKLFRHYAKELNADLCFQSFEKELENPLLKYGGTTGCLLLATYNNIWVGCVALQKIESGICEMKRLYVEPNYRKFGIGKALAIKIIEEAIQMGYHTMKLDTLQRLQPAIALYKQLGFTTTNAYYHNPLEEVVYMEKGL